ncbi:MAG: PH domain-containing protein [Verrucomicrobiales bacterium]|nr:PH domain-containing protein [Verrucomicrobiales bacterium]
MGLFSALLGNASEIDTSSLEEEFSRLLIKDETIQHAYKLFRDLIVFTEHRLFLVDKQGLTGRKTSYTAIPYRSINTYSVETAGHFDLDAEISISIKGRPNPITLEFKRDAQIFDVYRLLGHYVAAHG